MSNNHYAVIMAGGTGTRLWPLSRQKKPKQFHKLTSHRTMIQETYRRVSKIVPRENIYISTVKRYKKIIKEQFPSLKNSQLIIEPVPRNTAPAIGLVAQKINRVNPAGIVATIASDHAIKNEDEFVLSLKAAFSAATEYPESLVTIGISPSYPDTGLGYIKMGKAISSLGGKRVFIAESFKEKPDLKTARKYLATGKYYWNASYFIFSAARMLEQFRKHLPDTYRKINGMKSAQSEKMARQIFSSIKEEPFDTAIVERLEPRERLVVPSELVWSDVGNWAALFDFFKDGYQSSEGIKGNYISYESNNCIIQTHRKMIATVGIENVVIIDTEDAILIAHKDRVQDVKKIIEELKRQGKEKHL